MRQLDRGAAKIVDVPRPPQPKVNALPLLKHRAQPLPDLVARQKVADRRPLLAKEKKVALETKKLRPLPQLAPKLCPERYTRPVR